MLKHFIGKVCGNKAFRFFKPRIVVCVPSGVTEVEKRAVREAQCRPVRENISYWEPIAAAIGAGIDIQRLAEACNRCGGGTTDIAVISLGGIVVSASIKVAGTSLMRLFQDIWGKNTISWLGTYCWRVKNQYWYGLPRVQEVSMKFAEGISYRVCQKLLPLLLGDYGSIGRAGFKHCGSCTFGSWKDAAWACFGYKRPRNCDDGGGSLIYGLTSWYRKRRE